MDKAQFLEKAKSYGKPVVVDFWAPWCAPCRKDKPVLERLAGEYRDSVDFWPINSDQNQELLQELKIYGIPTVLLVQDGEIVGRFTGVQREDAYRRMFEALSKGDSLPTPISPVDRFLRLGVGSAAVLFALQTSTWWLLPLGFLILFTGVYDRCPIWKIVASYFEKLKKTS